MWSALGHPSPCCHWLQSHCQGISAPRTPRSPGFYPLQLQLSSQCATVWRVLALLQSVPISATGSLPGCHLPWLQLPYPGMSCAEHLLSSGSRPALAPATPPDCPLCGEPWDILGCIHFSFNYTARVPSVWRNQGSPWPRPTPPSPYLARALCMRRAVDPRITTNSVSAILPVCLLCGEP